MYPSSGACDYSVELPHWSCVLGSMCLGVSVWLGWSGIRVAGWSLMMDILMSETCWAHKKWNKNSKWHQVDLLFSTMLHNIYYLLLLLVSVTRCGQIQRANLTFRGPCFVMYSCNGSQRDALFLKYIWYSTLHVSDRSTVVCLLAWSVPFWPR